MSSAGRTRHRITIKRPTTTVDEWGGSAVSYATVATYWAAVNRLGGSRGLEYQEANFKRPYEITVRQYADILEDDVIEFEGVDLVIQGIEKDLARKRYMVITATESYEG